MIESTTPPIGGVALLFGYSPSMYTGAHVIFTHTIVHSQTHVYMHICMPHNSALESVDDAGCNESRTRNFPRVFASVRFRHSRSEHISRGNGLRGKVEKNKKLRIYLFGQFSSHSSWVCTIDFVSRSKFQ